MPGRQITDAAPRVRERRQPRPPVPLRRSRWDPDSAVRGAMATLKPPSGTLPDEVRSGTGRRGRGSRPVGVSAFFSCLGAPPFASTLWAPVLAMAADGLGGMSRRDPWIPASHTDRSRPRSQIGSRCRFVGLLCPDP